MAATLTTKFREDKANKIAEPKEEWKRQRQQKKNIFGEYLRAQIASQKRKIGGNDNNGTMSTAKMGECTKNRRRKKC